MDDEAEMDLAQDNFEDEDVDDAPIDDNASIYEDVEEIEEVVEDVEEDVGPTTDNFRVDRYKPSQNTPNNLPTIREELREDSRCTSSRVTTRPGSAMSEKSDDFSGQFGFGNGGNPIDKYTEEVFSEENRAELLFPNDLCSKGGFSPARDKQNSWEPSVYHYEKQPTPEVQNNSPGLIFANLTNMNRSQRDGRVLLDRQKEDNIPQKTSPEKSIFATSPMNSTKYLETKTSTPKRPTTSSRRGGLPLLEYSTICESPQRSTTSSLFQSRPQSNVQTPSSIVTSESMVPNVTISDSVIQKVLSQKDTDLMMALEKARKCRGERDKEKKPDFRLNVSQPKKLIAVPPPSVPRYSATSTTNTQNASSSSSALPSQTVPSRPQNRNISRNATSELTNSNTTNFTNNMSRLSTARSESIRSGRSHHGGFSDSSSSTVIPNSNSTTNILRDGRDSVSSQRTVSRASSTMTGSSVVFNKPLLIVQKRLAFGCVAINEVLYMDLEIQNISDRQCQVRTTVKSTSNSFQVQDNALTIVQPNKVVILRIAFKPSQVGRFQTMLAVEVVAQNFCQQIPMWGFGGVANISPMAKNLLPTKNPSEFIMHIVDLRQLSFTLFNKNGNQKGFALVTVFDASNLPIDDKLVRYYPSRGVIIKPGQTMNMEIRISSSFSNNYDDRAPSAMSNASSTRRITGADYYVKVCWGEEHMRYRMRVLQAATKKHEVIDDHCFTSVRFEGEEPYSSPQNGFPAIIQDDIGLFSSSYRKFFINFFSSWSALNKYKEEHNESYGDGNVTILETTAFRNQTFVKDATMIQKPPRRH